MKNALIAITLKKKYTETDGQLDNYINCLLSDIQNKHYNFDKHDKTIFTQRGSNGIKRRRIYSYPFKSIEYVLCEYLKYRIDRAFKISYSNRQRVISLLFNTLSILNNLNDFVILRFDFKSFFDSVPSDFILNKYLLNSSLSRKDKDILHSFCNTFTHCYAGLQTSNAMTEIACKDFDRVFKARLRSYGVIYCERYVDDVLVIMNTHITEARAIEVIEQCIDDTFPRDTVKLNPLKFNYISRRHLNNSNPFDFLGYYFDIQIPSNSNDIKFKFGITKAKIKRYTSKIRNTIIEYKKNQNTELLRHRIKAFSCRIVYSRIQKNKSYDWYTRGLIVNYRELRFHLSDLNRDTKNFLLHAYHKEIRRENLSIPYFLNKTCTKMNNSLYSLYSCLKTNRSIVLDDNVGIKRKDLVQLIRKLNPEFQQLNKTYFQIVQNYFKMLNL